jgi:hypothetical protein
MNNFDLRKFLAEGKLYEEAASTEEAMDKPSTKMKMSELKAKIRTEILAELSLNEDEEDNFMGGAETQADVDFYEGLEEATKDGDGEVPSKDKDTDIDIIDKEKVEVDVKEKPKMKAPSNDFLDQLEDLQDEAEKIGDNKLKRQIDNTITYFTRQHIAKDTNESLNLEENDMDLVRDLEAELKEGDKEYYDAAERDDAAHIAALEKDMKDDKRSSMNESLKNKTTMKESLEILRMKKLAGLITEGEYSKALLSEAKNPAKLKMMKNQLEMMLSELDNYLDSNTVDVEEGMMPRIEALIRDINTLMGGRTGLRENLDQELEAKIKSKIEDVMLEPDTKMIDGVLHVDFDVIGTLWMDTFEETFGREFDDVEGSDEDYNNFSKIQDISYNLLSNDGEIEVKYDY